MMNTLEEARDGIQALRDRCAELEIKLLRARTETASSFEQDVLDYAKKNVEKAKRKLASAAELIDQAERNGPA